MTLPMNDDFANRELSIEELEAIAAGGWLGRAWHWVEHEAGKVWDGVTSPSGQAVLSIGAIVLGILGGGGGSGNGGSTLKQN
jgi:hypothetical protein